MSTIPYMEHVGWYYTARTVESWLWIGHSRYIAREEAHPHHLKQEPHSTMKPLQLFVGFALKSQTTHIHWTPLTHPSCKAMTKHGFFKTTVQGKMRKKAYALLVLLLLFVNSQTMWICPKAKDTWIPLCTQVPFSSFLLSNRLHSASSFDWDVRLEHKGSCMNKSGLSNPLHKLVLLLSRFAQ